MNSRLWGEVASCCVDTDRSVCCYIDWGLVGEQAVDVYFAFCAQV
jgi:hypothetical protein